VPGTKWAYNNWDYNTLITIFEKQTGLKEKDVFLEQIAVPLDMQDITDSTVLYHKDPTLSQHSSIEYNLSARDMLKFGLLCLHKGNWKGKQVIPQDYFDRITTDYVKTGVPGLRSGYGYMWWVPFDRVAKKFGIPEGTFSADGMGSQRIIIIPALETVIVHKANTNLRKGFLMWLSDSGYEESDSTFIKTNLDSLLIEFVNVIGIRCKEPDFTDNPICQECKMVSDEDFQALLKMIIDAKM
jgi:CubicO group peptidase (beta-lactamase class C family)